MLNLFIVLSFIVGYFVVVYRETMRYAIKDIEEHIVEYRIIATPEKIDRWRRESLGFGLLPALFWPVSIPMRLLANSAIRKMPPTSYERELAVKQREDKVAALERELGIKR